MKKKNYYSEFKLRTRGVLCSSPEERAELLVNSVLYGALVNLGDPVLLIMEKGALHELSRVFASLVLGEAVVEPEETFRGVALGSEQLAVGVLEGEALLRRAPEPFQLYHNIVLANSYFIQVVFTHHLHFLTDTISLFVACVEELFQLGLAFISLFLGVGAEILLEFLVVQKELARILLILRIYFRWSWQLWRPGAFLREVRIGRAEAREQDLPFLGCLRDTGFDVLH